MDFVVSVAQNVSWALLGHMIGEFTLAVGLGGLSFYCLRCVARRALRRRKRQPVVEGWVAEVKELSYQEEEEKEVER